jgi:hypothetical protein
MEWILGKPNAAEPGRLGGLRLRDTLVRGKCTVQTHGKAGKRRHGD